MNHGPVTNIKLEIETLRCLGNFTFRPFPAYHSLLNFPALRTQGDMFDGNVHFHQEI